MTMFGIYWWTLIMKRKYEKLSLSAPESNSSGWVIILQGPPIYEFNSHCNILFSSQVLRLVNTEAAGRIVQKT
jgi:hypothetical protein